MKTKNFIYILLVFANLAVALSCYFFPVSRDEFFYLDKVNTPNPFTEYLDSYFYTNPRINQFFTNVICRSRFLEILFGLLIFNAFFTVIFLNLYRRLPKIGNTKDVSKYLAVSSFFIFIISYFGEMFYYVPFSTNYTLSHIFYLLYVFVLSAYYIHNQTEYLKKIPAILLFFLGIYTGMCNEHIPPVLILFSFVGALFYIFKNKKLPDFKILICNISICIGYVLLFFAPANKVKVQTVNKSPLEITSSEYLQNILRIFKYYFYYNIELIAVSLIVIITGIYFFRKIRSEKVVLKRILLYSALAAVSLAVVGFSPLAGVRLMFFATIMFFLMICELLFMILKEVRISKILSFASFIWLVLFSVMSVFITFRADQNYRSICNEISESSRSGKEVILDKGFNYFSSEFGIFNRKILLESGEDYIDKNPQSDTSQEANLKSFFNIKNLSHR